MKNQNNTVCEFTQVLPIRKANKIAVINNFQVAIYSKLDLIVVNHSNETPLSELANSKVKISELDFKVKF